MTDNTIPVTAPEVNSEQSVNFGNSSLESSGFTSDPMAWEDVSRTLGLVGSRGRHAWTPDPDDDRYEGGKKVRLEPTGAVVYVGKDGSISGSYPHQPSPEQIALLRASYDDICKVLTPLDGVRPMHLRSLLEKFKATDLPINNHRVVGEVVYTGPLPDHIAKRTFYFYPSTNNPDLIAAVEVRDDFTAEYIRQKDLKRGDQKRCPIYLPYVKDGEAKTSVPFWKSGLPDDSTGWKAPLFLAGSFDKPKVMIHEGLKAAAAAQRSAEHNSGHPWQKFLAEFTHVALHGGARRGMVSLADLSALAGKEVYAMPDADKASYIGFANPLRSLLGQAGASACYVIHWNGFGTIMPKHWDIADPVPASRRDPKRPAISAAQLRSQFVLHEHAFDVKTVMEDGKPVLYVIMRESFAKKFVAVGDEMVEIERPSFRWPFDTFNRLMAASDNRPTVKGLPLATRMIKSGYTQHVDSFGYLPGGFIGGPRNEWMPHDRRFISGNQSKLNLYRPPAIEEVEPPKGGKMRVARIIYTFAMHLIHDPWERKTVIRWACNNLTAGYHDDGGSQKAPWAVLLQGKEFGVGKSTVGEILKMLVGFSNYSEVDGETLSEKFSAWAEGVQLVTCEELKDEESPARRTGHYQKLKKPITNYTAKVRRMGTDPYEVENLMSFLLMSNHVIRLPRGDRRMFLPTLTKLRVPKDPKVVGAAWRYLADETVPKDAPLEGWFFRMLWKRLNEVRGELMWLFRRYGIMLHNQERHWTLSSGEAPSVTPMLWRAAFDKAPETDKKSRLLENNPDGLDKVLDALLLEGEGGNAGAIIFQDVEAFVDKSGKRYGATVDDIMQGLEDRGFSAGTDKRACLFQIRSEGRNMKGWLWTREGVPTKVSEAVRQLYVFSDEWKTKLINFGLSVEGSGEVGRGSPQGERRSGTGEGPAEVEKKELPF